MPRRRPRALGAERGGERIARRQLEPAGQVDFFRALGRTFGRVSAIALAIALAGGVVLLDDHGWDGTAVAVAIVAGALPFVTAVGVVQARGMTRLRRAAATDHGASDLGEHVRRGAARAAALRSGIGVLTLAALYLAAVLAAQ